MEPFEAAKYIAKELEKEKAKLIILSGSVARGKENPNDLDIASIFSIQNALLDRKYRTNLIEKLSSEVGYDIDLFDFSEEYINNLIESYKESPFRIILNLACISMDSRNRWKGWPLAWIFGDKAKETLYPYECFQTEMMVLKGQQYLDKLRLRINPS